MADLTITTCTPVQVNKQWTGPASAAVAVGEAGYMVAASGQFGLADANGSAPVNEPEGVFIKAALQAGDTVTLVMDGWLDIGNALSSLDYGAPVWLSRTAGKLADVDEGDGILIGEVWPAFGNTTADKLLYVNPKTLADIAPNSVTNNMLAGGFLKVTLVAGGSAGDHTVTGITTADQIAFVGHFSTAAAIATLADLTSEFSITGTNTINTGGGTDTSSDQLMVMWLDLS